MHLIFSVHLARRAAARLCAILMLALVSSVSAGASDDIMITGGSLAMRPSAGPILLLGDRGFSVDNWVGAAGGIFTPYFYCNLLDGPCSPGDTVSLLGLWSGMDAPGRFTLDGVTYSSANMTAMQLAFSGSFRLPALSVSATVTAPFHFQGGVSYAPDVTKPGVRLRLSGSGVTTISLVPYTIDGVNTGRWRIVEVRYDFGTRVPAPFAAADIGDVGTAGTASSLADQVVVNGAGADIWGAADSFRFVHQSLSGTGGVAARVLSVQNTHAFAKAGVMLRDSLSPSAAMAVLGVKPDGGLEFMVRYAEGEPVFFIAGPLATAPAVFLRLTKGAANEVRAAQSADGLEWTEVGSAVVPFTSTDVMAGLAVTSHDRTTVNCAMFDHVGVWGAWASTNLLVEGGFEGYAPPALGLPGWLSDDQLRQVTAKSETHQPRSGANNGACWTTTFLDCGMYQEVTAPATGTYTLRIHASADRPGGLVGANVNGNSAVSREVAVAPFAVYAPSTMTFTASAGDVIRVWMYSPAQPGYVVIDDASLMLAETEARVVTQGTWTIQTTGTFGTFNLRGADFHADGTYEWGEVDALTACRTSCAPGTAVALRSTFVNHMPTNLMSFARGVTSLGGSAVAGWVEYGGALTLSGGIVTLPAVIGTEWPQLVSVVAPFAMDGALEGYDVVGVREPTLLFRQPLRGGGIATLELLVHPDASGHTVLTFYQLRYEFSDVGPAEAEHYADLVSPA